MIRLVPREDPVVVVDEEPALRLLVQSAFGMRRKQMKRILREVYAFDVEETGRLLVAAGIDPEARPETLAAEQFATLLRAIGTRDRRA